MPKAPTAPEWATSALDAAPNAACDSLSVGIRGCAMPSARSRWCGGVCGRTVGGGALDVPVFQRKNKKSTARAHAVFVSRAPPARAVTARVLATLAVRVACARASGVVEGLLWDTTRTSAEAPQCLRSCLSTGVRRRATAGAWTARARAAPSGIGGPASCLTCAPPGPAPLPAPSPWRTAPQPRAAATLTTLAAAAAAATLARRWLAARTQCGWPCPSSQCKCEPFRPGVSKQSLAVGTPSFSNGRSAGEPNGACCRPSSCGPPWRGRAALLRSS